MEEKKTAVNYTKGVNGFHIYILKVSQKSLDKSYQVLVFFLWGKEW